MERLVYAGLIKQGSHSEGDDITFISGLDDPLADELESQIANKIVTVRYWISDRELTKERLIEQTVLSYTGALDVEFHHAYSEITGYLWTDERIQVGGHDLLEEISSNTGNYIWLEIDVHDEEP